MVAGFFEKIGHVVTVPVVERRTTNSEWYVTIYLPQAFGKIKETNSRRRIILHQGNASLHAFAETMSFLTNGKAELISHTALVWHPMTSYYRSPKIK